MLGPQTLPKAYSQARLAEQSLQLHDGHTQVLLKGTRVTLLNPSTTWNNNSRADGAGNHHEVNRSVGSSRASLPCNK